jgi:AraC family transcriptional regulator
MNTLRSDQNYRERVARVVAAIVADPMAEHRLENLARLAHFSPYHFHRVYSSIAGETVAATIRRVRLTLASRLLEGVRQSITRVALSVGYDSPQAFTRAFSQFAGQSPRAFQEQMHDLIFDAEGPSIGDVENIEPSTSVRVVDRPAQRAYAIRHCGPLSTIPHTHRRLRRHPNAGGASEWLGASFGDPEDTAEFRYYAAAVPREPWLSADVDIEMLDIPGGRYALHRLAGSYTRINAAMNALYSRWLPGSGYEPDDRPTLEHYLNSPREATQLELRTDLLIPIRSATAR